jgi:uroporphyrin-3 C-methyltransferase
MQSMSRSRDENLVADIESVRMAQQQAELGQPAAAGGQPQISQKARGKHGPAALAPVVRAIDLDLDKLSRMSVTDTTGCSAVSKT